MFKQRYEKYKARFWILLALTFLFWNPYTRQVILFLLPLGSGVDDVIFWFLAILTGVVWIFLQFLNKEKNEDY